MVDAVEDRSNFDDADAAEIVVAVLVAVFAVLGILVCIKRIRNLRRDRQEHSRQQLLLAAAAACRQDDDLRGRTLPTPTSIRDQALHVAASDHLTNIRLSLGSGRSSGSLETTNRPLPALERARRSGGSMSRGDQALHVAASDHLTNIRLSLGSGRSSGSLETTNRPLPALERARRSGGRMSNSSWVSDEGRETFDVSNSDEHPEDLRFSV